MKTSPYLKKTSILDFLRVYLITDYMRVGKSRFLGALEEALQSGVRAIQLREKNMHPKDLLALALEVNSMTQR